jgi:hypothetical protein
MHEYMEKAFAKALGISEEDLEAALAGGKTMWQVAEEKGMTVDLSLHPQTGAVIVRPGVRHFERGKTTKRFRTAADALLDERAALYRALAK